MVAESLSEVRTSRGKGPSSGCPTLRAKSRRCAPPGAQHKPRDPGPPGEGLFWHRRSAIRRDVARQQHPWKHPRLPRHNFHTQNQLQRGGERNRHTKHGLRNGPCWSRAAKTKARRPGFPFLFWVAASSRYVVRRDWSRARGRRFAPPGIPARLVRGTLACSPPRGQAGACWAVGGWKINADCWCICLESLT